MIHKYEIRPPYPTKYNIQQKTTSQTTQPKPKPKYKIHTQNKNHRKYHHTLHIKYPSHPSNSKYLQLHSKTNLQTKHRKHLKQILHPTNKIHPKDMSFPKRNSHPKHEKPNSITKRYKSQSIPNKLPFSTPNYHSNYNKYQKNKMASAYRPRHKTKNKNRTNFTQYWETNPTTSKHIKLQLIPKQLKNIIPTPPITPLQQNPHQTNTTNQTRTNQR